MLSAALEAEVAAYLEQNRGERDEAGHALVVRNGRAQARRLTLGSGNGGDRRTSQRFLRCWGRRRVRG